MSIFTFVPQVKFNPDDVIMYGFFKTDKLCDVGLSCNVNILSYEDNDKRVLRDNYKLTGLAFLFSTNSRENPYVLITEQLSKPYEDFNSSSSRATKGTCYRGHLTLEAAKDNKRLKYYSGMSCYRTWDNILEAVVDESVFKDALFYSIDQCMSIHVSYGLVIIVHARTGVVSATPHIESAYWISKSGEKNYFPHGTVQLVGFSMHLEPAAIPEPEVKKSEETPYPTEWNMEVTYKSKIIDETPRVVYRSKVVPVEFSDADLKRYPTFDDAWFNTIFTPDRMWVKLKEHGCIQMIKTSDVVQIIGTPVV